MRQTRTKLAWLVVGVACVGCGVGPSGPGAGNRAATNTAADIDIIVRAKDYVRRFLKFPDDATFPFWEQPEVRRNASGDTVAVRGKVKAKNAFGAELTHAWIVILCRSSGDWELTACTIGDEVVYQSRDSARPETGSWATFWANLKAQAEAEEREQATVEREAQPSQGDVPVPASPPESDQNRTAESFQPRDEPTPERSLRTWTDASGQHEIEAEFGGAIGKNVKLKKADGEIVMVPLDRLSAQDRAWIKARGKR